MRIEQSLIQGSFSGKLFVRSYKGDEQPKGVLQILHGMAEHCGRYGDFAEFLCEQGFDVIVYDHRKHGKSLREEDVFGIFDKTDRWESIIEDVHIVSQKIKEEYPGIPVFMLGHSMGSVILRSYLSNHGKGIKGSIIMGSPTPNPLMSTIALGLSSIICLFTDRK